MYSTTEKSNVLVLGRDRKKINFKINGSDIKRVASFKYLGLILSNNGKYCEAIEEHLEKAKRASCSIIKRAKQLKLTVSCTVHIINTIVKPILLFGCKVFCFANISSLESFYLSLLKKILVVRKSTPSYMVYGEVGCRPLRFEVRERACSFWLRIQENSSPTLANKLRKTLIKMNGTLNYVSPYATYISTNFNELGLSYMYATPRILDTSRDISLIKSRSRDQYVQEWTENKNNSRKALFYNMFKSKFQLEHYLDALPYKKRISLSRFRLSNHHLPIEKGRWEGTDRANRFCPLCTGNTMGDEFHYLFECKALMNERKKYLDKNFFCHPNVFKTSQLFNSKNKITLEKLANLVQFINSKF